MNSTENSMVEALSLAQLKTNLVPRAIDSHKGDFGHVLLVGGAPGFIGAVCLAGEAALRVGSGLVSIATRKEHAAQITMGRPELMVYGVETSSMLQTLSSRCTVVAIGPGLGQGRWSQHMLDTTLYMKKPMIVDADAINLLACEPHYNNDWVLTPHPGEAARLLKCDTADIQQDRLSAVKEVQRIYGGIVVLKGSGTLVCDGGPTIYTCSAGNPGMAAGGMGDVLTGTIAGLVAQKLTLVDAAKLGVIVHALAGDRAAKQGEKGMLASDLTPYIREIVNEH